MAKSAANELYQFSLLNALMAGVASTGIAVRELTSFNLGLGTFKHINGEMVLLDGHIYQLKSDGSVHEASPDDVIPFVMATNLEPTKTFKTKLESKDVLHRKLLDLFGENFPIAYRIDSAGASWKRIKVRAIAAQQYKHQPLSELGETEQRFEFNKVTGNLAGFYSPTYLRGLSVGEHVHFLSEDRKFGGHLLEMEADEVVVQAAVCRTLKIHLPSSTEFGEADLNADDNSVNKVEG